LVLVGEMVVDFYFKFNIQKK